MIYAVIVAIVAFIIGWFFAPLAVIHQSGNCAVESLFIYDEPQKNVITHGRWFSQSASQEHYYQARLVINEEGKVPESIISHRTINTSVDIHRDSVSVYTDKTFRIAGPDVSDPKWGRYIDPMAEAGYSNRIFLFKADGGRQLAGYKGTPITTCLQ